MRQRSAGKLSIFLVAVLTAGAAGSQIQAFKNSPARPATAAQQAAKEQQVPTTARSRHSPVDTVEAHAKKL